MLGLIANSNLPVAPEFVLLPDFFDEPMPGVVVQGKVALKAEEVQEIIRLAGEARSPENTGTEQKLQPEGSTPRR